MFSWFPSSLFVIFSWESNLLNFCGSTRLEPATITATGRHHYLKAQNGLDLVKLWQLIFLTLNFFTDMSAHQSHNQSFFVCSCSRLSIVITGKDYSHYLWSIQSVISINTQASQLEIWLGVWFGDWAAYFPQTSIGFYWHTEIVKFGGSLLQNLSSYLYYLCSEKTKRELFPSSFPSHCEYFTDLFQARLHTGFSCSLRCTARRGKE